jgi:hypothetical protein
MFQAPEIELRDGELGVFAHNGVEGSRYFVTFWNMREGDTAKKGLYGMDVEIPGCRILFFDPGFKANVRRVWVEGGGRPLQVTKINFGKPDKRTIAIAVVREEHAERAVASCVKGQSGTLALLQGPQREQNIKGRRIGFPGSDEAQKVLAEQLFRCEVARNHAEHAKDMACGQVLFGARLATLAQRRVENGMGGIRRDELNFVFVGEKNLYGGEKSFLYTEEHVADAEEETEREIARAQFLMLVGEQLRFRMETLGMRWYEAPLYNGKYICSVSPASVEQDGYAEYFDCVPESIQAITELVDRVEHAVRARSAVANALLDAPRTPSEKPPSSSPSEDIPASESVSEQVVDLPTAPASQDALARLLASGLGGAGAQKKRR